MTHMVFLVAAVCLPLCMAVLSVGEEKKGTKKVFGRAVLTTAVSNACMVLAAIVMGSRMTCFELLLINALAAAAIAMVVHPLVENKTIDNVQLLKAVAAISIVVAIYSILTVGQTNIHGDVATASLLTRAQIKQGEFFPKNWYYVNGDIWVFTVQLFVAPFSLLLEDQSLARMLGSAVLVLTAVFAFAYHSRKAFGNHSWVIAVPICVLFLMGVVDMILYQAAYTTQIIWLLVCPYLFFRVQGNTCKVKDYVIFGVLIVLMTMGGSRMIAEVVLPAWGAYIVPVYLKLREEEKINWKKEIARVIRPSAAIILPAIIGLALYLWISSTHHMHIMLENMMSFELSVKGFMENVIDYFANIFICFGYTGGISLLTLDGIMNMVSILMCLLIVFVVPVLQARKIKNESPYVQYLFAFALVHNLIMFVLIVLFRGKQNDRYVLTSIFVWIILSARYIYVYWISQKHFEKYIWTGLFIFAVMLGSVSLLVDSIGWEDKLSDQEEVSQQLTEYGLTKGYADFWTAYGQELYSDFEIRYGGLSVNAGVPCAHYWLVEGDVFEVQEIPTFLLLTEKENQENGEQLLTYFEEPVHYLEINGYHIYIFDYDISSDLVHP